MTVSDFPLFVRLPSAVHLTLVCFAWTSLYTLWQAISTLSGASAKAQLTNPLVLVTATNQILIAKAW
jgi:hypothetical protein